MFPLRLNELQTSLRRPSQFARSSPAPQGRLPFSITQSSGWGAILILPSPLTGRGESFHQIQGFTGWES